MASLRLTPSPPKHRTLLPYRRRWTALMGAAFEGDIAVVRRLLQSGAASDLQNNNGNTVLTIARQRHHTEIVALLGEFGVNTEDGLSGMMGLFAQLQAQFPDSVAAIHRQ